MRAIWRGAWAAWLATLAAVASPGAAHVAPLTAGFYLPWDVASQASLTAHAGALQVVLPMLGAVDTPQGHVRWQPDPARPKALAAAHKPRVMPTVSNAHDEVWDAVAAEAVMTDPAAGRAAIAELAAQAAAQGYGGYVLDFENLTPKGQAAYAPFVAQLRAALKPAGREVWVTALFSTDPAMLKALAAAADTVVLMAYDQCWATSTPGPIAGNDWLKASLDAKLAGLDPAHVVVALGAYGYDWPAGGTAAVVSASQAQAQARAGHAAVVRNLPDGNPHFAYTAGDGRAHQVWWLDAGTFRAQRADALTRRVRGVAIWRLGLEDPGLWTKGAAAPALSPGQPAPFCTLLPH